MGASTPKTVKQLDTPPATNPTQGVDGIKRYRNFKDYFSQVKTGLDEAHKDGMKVIRPGSR